ncbi:MAG: (Fe-S)-binding protein [Firmicutes bacterium]|nr:(Fe-S)-binding protein [Bacillota bacterium]
MGKAITMRELAAADGQVVRLDPADFVPLPPPYDGAEGRPPLRSLTESQKQRLDDSLDGFTALRLPHPQNREEEDQLVRRFLEGVRRLLSADDNWTFLGPLMLRLDYCAKCQTCAEACPIYLASGRQEIYRPTFRSELLRRIIKKYVAPGGRIWSGFQGADVDLNWRTVARLGELAYRCTLCRRCAQVCPIGIGNALIAREIRKVFSQELGLAPPELHRLGTVQQLKIGSSTGMSPAALMDSIELMQEEVEEKTGMKFAWPVDREGADILLIHNAGEFLSWPENPEAFAIILEKAGISWTLSSELVGYDAVNYGVWYDDVQLARIALRHAEVARKLKVKKIVIGECGHAHKALTVVADRILGGELNVPRESCLTLLDHLVSSGRLRLDPQRNDFPVTLHDPCNIVRLMGIVEPQRRILRRIAPRFREMSPSGTRNYCCGGGSGFAIMDGLNFPDWRSGVAGRMKFKQILDAFAGELDASVPKYVCAPCSNCKGQLRGLLDYFDATRKCGIYYGGLVELIVNAMADLERPFITFDADLIPAVRA